MQNKVNSTDIKQTNNEQNLSATEQMKIIRQSKLCELTGLSRSMIYLKMNANSPYFDAAFPRSIPLGKRAVGWRLREVNSYLNNLK